MTDMLLTPEWKTPRTVRALFSLRGGGVSDPPHHSLNLSASVDDDESAVSENRIRLRHHLPNSPRWLCQAHSSRAVNAKDISPDETVADASYTFKTNEICAVTTADCLPVLLCTADGRGVAAVHAGWRGLAEGVLETAAASLRGNGGGDLLAWIGPAISKTHYEVGSDVHSALCRNSDDAECFEQTGEGKWHADLPALALRRLRDLNITATSSGLCTYADSKRFFSARRDGAKTGRMAAMIWLADVNNE